MLDITHVESEGRMHNDTPGKIFSTLKSDVICCFIFEYSQLVNPALTERFVDFLKTFFKKTIVRLITN